MKRLLIPLFALGLLAGCSSPTDSTSDSSVPVTDTATETVVIKTSLGDITLELYPDKAPKAVENFVTHAKNGYYDGQQFHRVIPDFMIQGGDPTGTGTGGESIYGSEFEDEPNDVELVRGVLAMANRGPNTNGSQFFIIQTSSTPWLQGKHTGFGKVTSGLEVVDSIAGVATNAQGKPDTPVTYTMEVQ